MSALPGHRLALAVRVIIVWVMCLAWIIPSWGEGFSLKGQNEARYRRGYLSGRATGASIGSFENSLDLTASYNRIRLYLRQRYLLPSEFNVTQTGLAAFDKRYLEYRQDDWRLRGGSFYRIWGRGLLFGTAEKVEINYDNGLEGLLVEGGLKGWDGAAFKGVHTDADGVIRENAEGARLSWRTPKLLDLRLGTSLVYMEESRLHPRLDRRGYEIEIRRDIAGLYLAYTNDKPGFSENLLPTTLQYPHGFYGAFTVGDLNWGLLVDYKNYRLLVEDPYADFPQPFLQYPPTAFPEATIALLDRQQRAFKTYADEVGAQMELTASAGDWSGRLNLTLGSEQNGDRMLPSIHAKSSRYRGIFVYAENYQSTGNRLVLRAAQLVDIQVVPPLTREDTYWYKRNAGAAEYFLPLTEFLTLQAELELLWFVLDQDIAGEKSTFNSYRDESLNLGLLRSPDFAFNAVIVRSGDRNETGGLQWNDRHRYWPSAELALNIGHGHQVRLFGGHEQGGVRCAGGLCRWVNPFRGAKISLTSQF